MKKRLILFLLLLIIIFPVASSHVSYVLEDNELKSNLGNDLTYFLSPLKDNINIVLILSTILVFVLLYYFLPKIPAFSKETKYIKKEASSYVDHIPWICRLGLGIALIGAGTTGVLISPTIESIPILNTIQILLGFFLMAGFFTSLAAWGSVILFFYALYNNPYLLGNLDFLGLAFALIATHNSEPGIDDILGIPFLPHLKDFSKYVPVISSITIGFAMVYLAVFEKILNPHISRLVVEQYALTSIIPVSAAMWVFAVGIIEFLVGFLLLIRFKPRLISTIAFVVLSFSFFYFEEAVFSHITLFAILSIVFIYGKKEKNKKSNRHKKKLKRRKI